MAEDDFERLARQVQWAALAAGGVLEPFLQQQERLVGQLQSLTDTAQMIAEAVQPIVFQVQARIAPFLDQVSRAFQELPERNQKALRILAVNGWYLDPGMQLPRLFAAADLFEARETDRANEKMCEHFDNRLNEIETHVCSKFSSRARILQQAFAAHRRGEYALTVPVFLSQADGVCKDLVGVQLYARANGMAALAACLHVEKLSPLKASFFYPLVDPNPISAGPADRAGSGDLLNRHAVIHGESVDYDSRLNSCRSVSLLVYVAWIHKRAEAASESREISSTS